MLECQIHKNNKNFPFGMADEYWCPIPYATSNLGKRRLSQIWPKDIQVINFMK